MTYYSRSRVKFKLEVDHRYLRGKHILKAGDLVTIKIPETKIEKLLRITSIERNLKTGKVNCTVSNYLDEKWEKKIEGAISDLKANVSGGGGGGGGGTSIDIIKSTDLTIETDENVYSSLRTLIEINNAMIEVHGMYLRKDIDDTAHGVISFDSKIGSSIFLDGYEGKGWKIEPNGAAMLDSARVRSDIFIGGKFGSPSYASGFTGWGVEIDIPTASITTDFLTVRKSMKVYELVYSQIYGLGGSHIVSDLNKILYVETCQGFYRCYMDSMDKTMRMNLRKDDIVRMQRSSGINIRYFYGEVLKVTPDYFDLKIIDGQDTPEMGDVVFRFGNKTDKNRQGIIYLTSSDDNAPYIDVLDGITDMSMFEKIKVSIGNLSRIRTKKGVQLKGYGIYAKGAVFEDTDIYLQDGTTVEQQFIVMNGKFESTIEGIKNDMSVESGNILRNSSFGSNLDYWKPVNTVNFINVGGSYLWLDDAFYTEKGSVADIYRDGSKNVLRVRNTTITQRNDLFNGTNKAGSYSFAFFYKVLRAGTLTVGFTGKPLLYSGALAVSEEYQKLSKVAQWDGLGDFSISFTGEVLIYGVSLFNDALADAQIKMQTQIDQTNEHILLYAKKDYVDAETGQIYVHYNSELKITAEQISAVSTRINNVNNTIATAGWITTADGNRLFASLSTFNALTGRVNTAETNISNNAYNINLKASTSTVSDLTGRVRTAESEININAQGITQKVSSTDYNGQTIMTKVNQTSSAYTIDAKNINLYGAVTFSSFDYDTKETINKKADASSLGSLAYQSVMEKGFMDSSLQSEINGAMQTNTYISGGYMKLSFIDVDSLYVKSLSAIRGTIGCFNVSNTNLTCSRSGIYAGFGLSTAPATLGLDVPLWVQNKQSQDTVIGAYFSAENATNQYNNIAISMSGCISGFGVKVRQTTYSVTLSNGDCWVSCYNSSPITVNLPSNPTIGKMIFIKLMNDVSVTVGGNGKVIKYDSTCTSNPIEMHGRIGFYVYDGQYWCGGKIFF